MKISTIRNTTTTTLSLTLVGLLALSNVAPVHAESLFKAGIGYQTSQGYMPRSLFANQRPHTVGDMVTVSINEVNQLNIQNNNTIVREQTLNENNTGMLNRIIRSFTGVRGLLPSVNGLNNEHTLNMAGRSQKQFQLVDNMTCQVVQVLPNGFLVIQGRKMVGANQESQDFVLSGIVNPYFLDQNNTIASSQVANFSLQVAGRGVMTRQQGDGVIGKYFQFVN